jgi:excisionase family DNA binding protein
MAKDVFLTIKQAAERCGVTPATVRNWIKHGKLAYHQTVPGAPYYIRQHVLDEMLGEKINQKGQIQ